MIKELISISIKFDTNESLIDETIDLSITEEDLILKPWERNVLVDEKSEIAFQKELATYIFTEQEIGKYDRRSQSPEYQAGTLSMIEFGLITGLIKKIKVN